jgi:phage terminase large subunit-like protein
VASSRPARLPPGTDLVEFLLSLPPEDRAAEVLKLGFTEADAFDRDWDSWAHGGQKDPETAPDGAPWSVWVVKGGRGFGKTMTGSSWIARAVAEAEAPLRIALVGATLAEARKVMVEGKSGLMEVAGPWIREWSPSLGILKFRTGSEAALFSGHSPELLRGPEHHIAWCDELAKWEKPGETWDMLQLGLRLGTRPRALVTTTPRSGPHLRRIMESPRCAVTGGPTSANPHLSDLWQQAMVDLYAGTRLGRQELEGELLTDTPGALWSVELLERCRILPGTGRGTAQSAVEGESCQVLSPLRQPSAATSPSRGGSGAPFTRTIIAVDPPAADGTCGIVACARDGEGRAHVLADHSVAGRSPEGWARAVADAARIHGTNEVVAEQNQGGKMVAAVLRTADPSLRVKLVTATVGKSERAAPVAMLFEAGKVVLHGSFPELEAELMGMIAGGDYEGPGTSPDRADAMVWGLTELMLQKERAEPRVRLL